MRASTPLPAARRRSFPRSSKPSSRNGRRSSRRPARRWINKDTMKIIIASAALAAACAAPSSFAQNVKITPIGSHPGELCANDRATLFEDPTGVRILYDVGQTVTGPDDPRLGTVHAVLLSHIHGD